MMASSALLLALAVGCAPDPGPTFGGGGEELPRWAREGWYQDWFTPTYEICGEPDIYDPDLFAEDPEGACATALLADLKADLESLDQVDEGQHENAVLSAVLAGAGLLSWPMGTVDELRTYTDERSLYYLRDPLISELEDLSAMSGETRVRALIYNLAMSSMVRTVLHGSADKPDRDSANISTRTIYFGDCCRDAKRSFVLVHEATHIWLQQGHVACTDDVHVPAVDLAGQRSCDEDWHGAYGYEGGMAWLMGLLRDWDNETTYDSSIETDIYDSLSAATNMILENYD